MSIELVLLRHGQAEWVRDGVAVDDPPLTDLGRRQAAAAASALAEQPFSRFLASPVQRAHETASIVGAARGESPQIHEWLAEIKVPMLGRSREEFFRYFLASRRRAPRQWWDGFEQSESFRDFHVRVTTGLIAWLASDFGAVPYEVDDYTLWRVPNGEPRRVLVVAHGGTISVIAGHLLGIEPTPWEWERFDLNLCGMYRLRTVDLADGHIWSLHTANETEHLRDIDDDVQSPLE